MPLPEHLGFIGLGNMGGPIALRLLRAGFAMTVLDLDREKMRQLLQEGGWFNHHPSNEKTPELI
jgi:3-hydroxyisobutyrate dehydrogenase-like beta-hydroxyacid dehydrogenase